MSMYISFATKDNDDSVFFTTNAKYGIYSAITEQLGPIGMEDWGRNLRLEVKDLEYIFKDESSEVLSLKERIGLNLMKGDFDVVDMQWDIEMYETSLKQLGQLQILIDMAWDNDGLLWVNIG